MITTDECGGYKYYTERVIVDGNPYNRSMIAYNKTPFQIDKLEDDHFSLDNNSNAPSILCGNCKSNKFSFKIYLPKDEYAVNAECTECGFTSEIYSG